LLLAWASGDKASLDRLIPLVQNELHDIAHRYMRREAAGHTLQTTALVNEAYLKLVDVSRVAWQDRAHFFAVCANIMRRILVDEARHRRYQKRSGAVLVVPLDEGRIPPSPAWTSWPWTRRSAGSPRSTRRRPGSSSCGSSAA
jgi:RNA polymerase sigma factor (TIGR02999 family)